MAGICPNCSTSFEIEDRSCSNCGHSLQTACQNCATPNSLIAKFCRECGHALGAGQPIEPLAELRIVTTLFSDLSGSTAAAEQLDPEEWADLMAFVFPRMTSPIERFGGSVFRLLGDAVIAFFGAPTAHEDDPERAVRAALEIAHGMTDAVSKVRNRWKVDLDVRVGINTGLVRVGEIGSASYTALGDAVNLAARMEQTARPGTVQVAEATYQAVHRVFEWQDLGLIDVKGKSEPIHTYRPLGDFAGERPKRGIEGKMANLVGRTAELATLHSAAENLAAGIGGLISLIGEPGVGKSRLISEFRNILPSTITWLETASLSYETNQPYRTLQRLLQQSSLANWRSYLEANQIAVLETLLGGAVTEADPESLQMRLYESTRQLLAALLAQSPAVICFDDLHWSDPASLDMTERLLPLVDELPLLLILVQRPDRKTSAWQTRLHAESELPHVFRELVLTPFDSVEAATFITELTGTMPATIRDQIVERTDGNPFFLEEVVRSLLEGGLLERSDGRLQWIGDGAAVELDIPASVQALLTARIDRLDQHSKRTLHVASVIGRTFYQRLLAAVEHDSYQIEDRLSVLQRAELLTLRRSFPESEFAFRHALTQEAAYRAVLLKDRKHYHQRVAEAIVDLYHDQLETLSPVVADHFLHAGDRRELQYRMQAGERALALHALAEAETQFRRATELAVAPSTPEDQVLAAYLRLGRTLELTARYPEAIEVYRKLATLGEDRPAPQLVLQAELARALAHGIPATGSHDAEQSSRLAGKALDLARQWQDAEAEAKALWVLGVASMYGGSMKGAVPHLVESIDMARQNGLEVQLAQSLTDAATAIVATGDLSRGGGYLAEAAGIWERLGNLPMLAEALNTGTYRLVVAGDFPEALKSFEKASEVIAQTGNLWGSVTSRAFLASAFRCCGDTDRVFEHTDKVIADADHVGHPVAVLARCDRALTLAALGAFEDAHAQAEDALSRSLGFSPFRPLALAVAIRCLVRSGDLSTAREHAEEARSLQHIDTLLLIDFQRRLAMMELALATGDLDVTTRIGETVKYVDETGAGLFAAEIRLLAARCALAESTEDSALDHIAAGLLTADTMPDLHSGWRLAALRHGLVPTGATLEDARARADALADRLRDDRLRAAFHAQLLLELPDLRR